jgi:uncharacterized protein YceK
MKTSLWGGLTFAIAALLVCGCGTTANLFCFPAEEDKQVYGGIRADWKVVRESTQAEPSYCNNTADRLTRALLFTVDMPASLVGDTLTLPFTISQALGWLPKSEEKATPKIKDGATASAPATAEKP